MRRCAALLLAGCISAVHADAPPVAPELTVAQLVDKNIAAKGGLEAWRKIQSMVWIGHIESANGAAPHLPFVLELKRPNKTRFEIKVQNQLAVRVYDGSQGWKLRPVNNGMPDLQPYTAEELNFARDGQGIDGPLMDYRAKGISVGLDGVDEVEGRKAYRLNVKLPSGASHHVWIDAQSFLEIKSDRDARKASGLSGKVSMYYRNYRTMDGLQIPFSIETGAEHAKTRDKMVIDKLLLNPPLEDRMFSKPRMPGRRNAVANDAAFPQAERAAPPVSSRFSKMPPRPIPGLGDMR